MRTRYLLLAVCNPYSPGSDEWYVMGAILEYFNEGLAFDLEDLSNATFKHHSRFENSLPIFVTGKLLKIVHQGIDIPTKKDVPKRGDTVERTQNGNEWFPLGAFAKVKAVNEDDQVALVIFEDGHEYTTELKYVRVVR